VKKYLVADKNLLILLGLLTSTLLIINVRNFVADFFGQDIFLGYIKLFMVGLMLLSLFFFRLNSTTNPSKKDKTYTLLLFFISILVTIQQ